MEMVQRCKRATSAALLLLMAAGATSAAVAADEPEDRVKAIRPLLDCRQIAEPSERLTCFDRESASLDQAASNNQIAVVDRETVRQTRRSLFGLSLPRLPFFGGGDDDDDEDADDADKVREITSTLASVRALPHGEWQFTLADGARWQTIEPMPYGTPRAGMTIVIRKGALSSYKGRIENWVGVKMHRIN